MSEIKKCFIAFPTHGRDEAAIKADIEAAATFIREKGMEPAFELREHAEKPKDKAEAIRRAAKQIERLAECEAVCFCKGHRSSSVCQLLERAACIYNLTRFYAKPQKKKEPQECRTS